MPRRIFISYQHEDQMQAKGFRLLRWNNNVEVDFFDRHLLDPVKSKDDNYVKRCITEQMKGTSVQVVLIGEKTHQSKWVAWEIEKAREMGKGILGIRLKGAEGAQIPAGLTEVGAEVIGWGPSEFNDAIERAAIAAGRGTAAAAALGRGEGGDGCSR
ncbi:MAG TPA: TIR domain-containing protein [Candidatus Thermoplasmatota archaeon]|nr:TIR domain-containing protein [Candidatus Thermoplasmatota archaeon]